MAVKVGIGLPVNDYHAKMLEQKFANSGAFKFSFINFLGAIKIGNLLNL